MGRLRVLVKVLQTLIDLMVKTPLGEGLVGLKGNLFHC